MQLPNSIRRLVLILVFALVPLAPAYASLISVAAGASSGRWFNGWKRGTAKLVAAARGRPGIHAIATPHTWLLAEAWRKAGPLLDPAAAPG